MTFIFTRRIQIFVIIFRRLRFVESFGKVMRRKKYTKTDCQRRISHALEKYLLRIREEQVKKKREVKGRCELWGRGTIENFEANANAVRKKKFKRNWNEWICTENFYPHWRFIYARHFRKIVHFFQTIQKSFFFWNFLFRGKSQ